MPRSKGTKRKGLGVHRKKKGVAKFGGGSSRRPKKHGRK